MSKKTEKKISRKTWIVSVSFYNFDIDESW